MEFTGKKEIRILHTDGPVELFYKFDRAVNIRKIELFLKNPPMPCDILDVVLLGPSNETVCKFTQTDPTNDMYKDRIFQNFVGWKLLYGKGSLVITFSNFSDSVRVIAISYEVIQ